MDVRDAGVVWIPWDEICRSEAHRGLLVERGINPDDGVIRRWAGSALPAVDDEAALGDCILSRLMGKDEAKAAFQAFVDGKGPLPFVASDDSEDSYKDVLTGPWRLARFRNNPIVPLNHDYFSKLPVGTAMVKHDKTVIGTSQERLVGWATFDDADPEAARVAGKYRRKVMGGFSVGVRPTKAALRRDLPDDHPYKADRGLWLSDLELLEVSAVSIPANSSALAMRAAPEGLPDAADRDALRAFVRIHAETIRAALADLSAGAPAPAPTPSPIPPSEDFWSK